LSVVFSSILFLSFFACKVLENQKANIGLTDTASPIFFSVNHYVSMMYFRYFFEGIKLDYRK